METSFDIDLRKRYTYADYLTWADDKMRELWHGLVRLMSPAAGTSHQRIAGRLSRMLGNHIERRRGKCEVFNAPFDVRLPKGDAKADNQIDTVVQPDICVICDPAKIDERGCLGAPDMVIEVQSPATARYDLRDKFDIYQESGVREYWVVYPKDKAVDVFLLQADGKYDRGTHYDAPGKIPVSIFDGWEMELTDIFGE